MPASSQERTKIKVDAMRMQLDAERQGTPWPWYAWAMLVTLGVPLTAFIVRLPDMLRALPDLIRAIRGLP